MMSSFSCQHRHSTIALGDGRPIGTMRDGTKYAAGQLFSKPMVWMIFSYLAVSSLTDFRNAAGATPPGWCPFSISHSTAVIPAIYFAHHCRRCSGRCPDAEPSLHLVSRASGTLKWSALETERSSPRAAAATPPIEQSRTIDQVTTFGLRATQVFSSGLK
jgi:hypothetical protein